VQFSRGDIYKGVTHLEMKEDINGQSICMSSALGSLLLLLYNHPSSTHRSLHHLPYILCLPSTLSTFSSSSSPFLYIYLLVPFLKAGYPHIKEANGSHHFIHVDPSNPSEFRQKNKYYMNFKSICSTKCSKVA